MIKIGSARIDENGDIHSGAAGDQTGHEVETQDWYLHPKGWVVIRAKNRKAGELIAVCMKWICDNDLIGYDQWQDQSLYNAVKDLGFDPRKLTIKVETDCARAVRVCICYAGTELGITAMINCPDFWTGSEIAVLAGTDCFDIIRDPAITDHWERLCKGDILVTPTAGHTAVVLEDGPYAYEEPHDEMKPHAYRATDNVWLRTGASTDYAKLIVIPAGKVLNGTGLIRNNWAEGEYKGRHGFASMKYLERLEFERQAYLEVLPGKTARLRASAPAGATLKYLPAGTRLLMTDETVKILGTVWYEAIIDGVAGWVSGKLAKEVQA